MGQDALPARVRLDLSGACDRPRHLLDGIHQESGFAVGNDLWQCAAAEGDDWRATGHRLERDQRTGLRDQARDKYGPRTLEQADLLRKTRPPNEGDGHAVERGRDRAPPELLMVAEGINLAREDEPHARLPRRRDGEMRALLFADAS